MRVFELENIRSLTRRSRPLTIPVQGTVPERRPVRVLEAGDYLVIGAAQGEAASPADGDEALSDYVSASALIPESIERLDALREEEGKSATSKVSLQTADSASSSFAGKVQMGRH